MKMKLLIATATLMFAINGSHKISARAEHVFTTQAEAQRYAQTYLRILGVPGKENKNISEYKKIMTELHKRIKAKGMDHYRTPNDVLRAINEIRAGYKIVK